MLFMRCGCMCVEWCALDAQCTVWKTNDTGLTNLAIRSFVQLHLHVYVTAVYWHTTLIKRCVKRSDWYRQPQKVTIASSYNCFCSQRVTAARVDEVSPDT